MFSVDSIIDAVQTSKKQVIGTMIKDASIARGLNEMIDTQTAFAKAAATTSKDIGLKMVEESTRVANEFSKNVKTVVDALGNTVFVKELDKTGRDAVDMFWKEAGKWSTAFGQPQAAAVGSKAKTEV